MTIDYLVQQVDGTSRFTLQDGSGFILLQSSVAIVVRQETNITLFIPGNENLTVNIPGNEDLPIQLNDDEEIKVIG